VLIRRSRGSRRGRAFVGIGLAAALLALGAPAASADPPADQQDPPASTSPVGDAGDLPIGDYIQAGVNDPSQDATVDVGVVSEVDAVCAALPGAVAASDIPEDLRANPPKGEGKWVYEVCGDTKADSDRIARAQRTVFNAKRYCATGLTECGVFATWVPTVTQPPTARDFHRQSYLSSFFDFAPNLGSSPDFNADRGIVANFPAWFWNTVVTTFPKVIGDLGFFGGLVATAWHLNTEFTTDGVRACRVAGLRMVGTVWKPGMPDPARESPSRCGHTYTNQGVYNVHGCSEWLIVAVGPFFAIVFPITVCDDFAITVKDTQVLGTGHQTVPVR
jgi:hypothetical protein